MDIGCIFQVCWGSLKNRSASLSSGLISNRTLKSDQNHARPEILSKLQERQSNMALWGGGIRTSQRPGSRTSIPWMQFRTTCLWLTLQGQTAFGNEKPYAYEDSLLCDVGRRRSLAPHSWKVGKVMERLRISSKKCWASWYSCRDF